MFKQKNKKILTYDKRITLDAKHNEIISNFKQDQKTVLNCKNELSTLKKKLNELNINQSDYINTDNIQNKFNIENKISNLENKIFDLENNKNEIDYYVKTGKILYDYYDDIDNIAKNTNSKNKIDNISNNNTYTNQNNIMKFFSNTSISNNDSNLSKLELNISNNSNNDSNNNSNNDSNNDSNNNSNNNSKNLNINYNDKNNNSFDRAAQLDSYLKEIDKYYCPKIKFDKIIDYCPKCKKNNEYIEMVLNQSEGNILCTKCGYLELVVIDSDKPSYKDPPPEATYFAYKRINHFNELLAQIQAKESTDIPNIVFTSIISEIKKERITDLSKLTNEKIRSYLKKLNLNKYYEHVPHIINKLNGLPPPILTRDIEEKLRIMFREIQGPFMEICPKDRKNFLNYYYVFHKFVELLSLDEYKSLFPLLKSREKLHQQDIMWKKICNKLQWEYIKSI